MIEATFAERLRAVDLDELHERSRATSPARARQALGPGLPLAERLAALLSPAAGEELLEEMAQRAHRLTRQRFGHVLQMYAPLYLSNECIDSCTYCGFRIGNDIHRVTLSPDRVLLEAMLLKKQGFQHLLLVSGEHPRIVDQGYLTEVVRTLRPHFASLAIEVAPQYDEGYRELATAGVDAVVVYQETYDREVYAKVHPRGPKRRFDWRLEAPERAARAGMKRLGIGALLGLSGWRRDALATGLHADWLQRRWWRSQVAVSFPRLTPAIGMQHEPRPVPDEALVQYVCALRLCLPDAQLVLSTREPAALREGLVPLGITQMSAGSHTEPGGYSEPDEQAEQFGVADHRSPAEVAQRLRDMGYDVVWKDWEATLHARA